MQRIPISPMLNPAEEDHDLDQSTGFGNPYSAQPQSRAHYQRNLRNPSGRRGSTPIPYPAGSSYAVGSYPYPMMGQQYGYQQNGYFQVSIPFYVHGTLLKQKQFSDYAGRPESRRPVFQSYPSNRPSSSGDPYRLAEGSFSHSQYASGAQYSSNNVSQANHHQYYQEEYSSVPMARQGHGYHYSGGYQYSSNETFAPQQYRPNQQNTAASAEPMQPVGQYFDNQQASLNSQDKIQQFYQPQAAGPSTQSYGIVTQQQQVQFGIEATPHRRSQPHNLVYGTQTSEEQHEFLDPESPTDGKETSIQQHVEPLQVPGNFRLVGSLSPGNPKTWRNGLADDMRKLRGPLNATFKSPERIRILTAPISEEGQRRLLKRAELAEETGAEAIDDKSRLLLYDRPTTHGAPEADGSWSGGQAAGSSSSLLTNSISTLRVQIVQLPESPMEVFTQLGGLLCGVTSSVWKTRSKKPIKTLGCPRGRWSTMTKSSANYSNTGLRSSWPRTPRSYVWQKTSKKLQCKPSINGVVYLIWIYFRGFKGAKKVRILI